jgi:hypothetical protein
MSIAKRLTLGVLTLLGLWAVAYFVFRDVRHAAVPPGKPEPPTVASQPETSERGRTAVEDFLSVGTDRQLLSPEMFAELAAQEKIVDGPLQRIYAPGSTSRVTNPGATVRQDPGGVGSPDQTIDIGREGNVPDDFVEYVRAAVARAIPAWDRFYPSVGFSFAKSVGVVPVPVYITTNRAPFDALPNVEVARAAFTQPCLPRGFGPCPRVMVHFDPARWGRGDYPPADAFRIAHEVFHVAHYWMANILRQPDLFQRPGAYWQGEGIATFAQKLLGDPAPYNTFPSTIVNEGFFRWGTLANQRYERSYEPATFVDEMVYHSGDERRPLVDWMLDVDTDATLPSEYTFMRAFAPADGGDVDFGRFKLLYIKSILGLTFWGLRYPAVNERTINAGLYAFSSVKHPLTWPHQFVVSMDPVSAKLVKIDLDGVRKGLEALDTLSVGIKVADPRVLAGILGVVTMTRENTEGDLALCYSDASRSSDAKAAAQRCWKAHQSPLGASSQRNPSPIQIDTQALTAFGRERRHLYLTLLLTNTFLDTSPGRVELLRPIDVTVTLETNTPSPPPAPPAAPAEGTWREPTFTLKRVCDSLQYDRAHRYETVVINGREQFGVTGPQPGDITSPEYDNTDSTGSRLNARLEVTVPPAFTALDGAVLAVKGTVTIAATAQSGAYDVTASLMDPTTRDLDAAVIRVVPGRTVRAVLTGGLRIAHAKWEIPQGRGLTELVSWSCVENRFGPRTVAGRQPDYRPACGLVAFGPRDDGTLCNDFSREFKLQVTGSWEKTLGIVVVYEATTVKR